MYLVEDYGVEREEAAYKLDGLTRSTKIRFLPLTVDCARKSLEIAKIHKARSFDANLIASAETNEISVIISNDRHIAGSATSLSKTPSLEMSRER